MNGMKGKNEYINLNALPWKILLKNKYFLEFLFFHPFLQL
jgi:hypothetical protein